MTIDHKKRRKLLDRRRGVLVLDGLPIDLDSRKYNCGEPAKCYMAAYRIACDLAVHGVDRGCFRVGQGVVLCRNPASEWCGQRIMHAWVEWKVNGAWLVADGSRPDHPVWLGTRDQYYEGASICEADVWFYSLEEMTSLAARFEHYGPWRKPKVISADWTEADEAKVDAEGFYVDP